jgi:hypothetical protein
MNLTQKFNDTFSFLIVRTGATSEMIISDFLPIFNDLINALNSSRNLVNLETEEIKKLFIWMDLFKTKRAADKISLDDEKQLGLDVQFAYDKFTKSLSK